MQTALVPIASVAVMLVLTITALVLSGWFLRLAANGLERPFMMGESRPLTPRERTELVARLWVP